MTNTVGDAQIKLGLDASGVVTGIGEAKKSLDSLGASTQKAVGPITPEMEKASAATQRFAREVVKAELAAISGGKATAAYKQGLAELNGLSVNALKPYLESLRATEQAQRAATAATLSGNNALNGLGQTAKQTAAALRSVPAQFTDIVVSLQSGQAPLTVLLQQGGQLKDLFGGVGNAARALGGYVAGLVNPFTVTAAAVVAIGFAFEKGAQEQRDFQKTLILTGNAAGVTANLLSQAAANIDAASGATQGKAAEALNIFVNAGVRGRESLERFTASAIEFERAGGGAIDKVAENFAKLGKDPLKASLALNESMNFLTRSLYEQIKALEDQGKTTEAAKVAQEAYKSAIDTATPQLLQNLGSIERGWKAITDATKKAYDAALNVGRATTPAQQLSELQQRIAARGQTIASGGFSSNEGGAAFGRGSAGLSKLREEQAADELSLRSLSKKLLLETEVSGAKAEQARQNKALFEYDKIKEQYLDKQIKKEREIAQVKELAREAGKQVDPEVIAGINKKYEDKAPRQSSPVSESELTNLKARVQQEQIYLELLKTRGLEADKLNEGEKAAIRLQEELKGSLSGRARSIKEAALNQAELLSQTIKQADAEKDFLKRQEESAKAAAKSYEDLIASITKSTDSINSQIEKENDAAAAIGKTKDQIAELEAAKLDDLATSKDRLAVLAQDIDFSGQLSAKYAAEAEALRGLAEAKKNRAGAEVANTQLIDQAKAAQQAIDEWKRASDEISRSLTDALLRGFESGKGFGQNLKDTFKNLSKTLILKPIIEMPVKQAAAALAPLQQQFNKFIAERVLGERLVGDSAAAGAAKSIAASQASGQAAATAGIANQAGGDPYTAFFRIAAMTAIMAALGYAVKGGGSGAAPVTNQGTGTVFGDPAAKSASIENSLKLLETSRLGLKYSAQMAASLKNIEAAFAGVTNLLLRNGQIGKLEGSIATGTQETTLGRLLSPGSGSAALGPLGGFLNSLTNKLFGKTVTLQGSGITGGPQSFGDIQDIGFQGNYYADVETRRRFLGVTVSRSSSTILSALDADIADQFTKIFTGMGDSILAASQVFGLRTESINSALESYIVDIGKVDLRGLNGDQIQEKLSNVFGAEFDKLAETIIPGLQSIRQVGEGYSETLIRAATQLESVNTAFTLLGGSLSLFTKDADTFLEKMTSGLFGRTAPGIERAILADQLVQQFGGLEEFNSATQAFYESFYSQGERTSATLGLLSESLEGLGITLPDSIASWRDLTTSLDVTTEAGQQAFEALVTLGPAFADLQNQLLESAGISGSAIADVLRDGMLGRITQADIGSKLSSIIVDGIYNSVANGFAEQITQTFTSQIIAPLLQSVATGGVLSASISQASIDTVVATATNAASQLAAILGDKGFQAAIAGVQAAIAGISGAFPGLSSSAKEATPAYQSLGSAVNAASDAATKGADAWKSIGDSLTAEIDRIRGVLTGGDKASALASFTTLTAQTRAGDLEAGKLLPSASQAYIKAVEESASSLLDIRRAQGFALSSLVETRSIIGQGPTVSSPTSFTPSFTPSYSTGGAAQNTDAVIAELKLLRAQVARLEATSQTTADVLDKSAKAGNGGGALAVEVQA